MDLTERFRIGVITKTHGIKGEVTVFPTTDDSERFNYLENCYIKTKNEYKPVTVTDNKFFKNTVILKFDGIDSIEEAEKYIKCELYVDREDAVSLEEGEVYLADMIGMEVVLEDRSSLGTLKDYMETPAQLIFVVELSEEVKKNHGDKISEIMIPDVPEFIKEVDVETGRMTVKLLKGMLPE
ncbi:MAG: ribosome maturation factor RimM [Eubacterium sp.]|nr:ribosome maturation factor RimM [Eubacterium sp.]